MNRQTNAARALLLAFAVLSLAAIALGAAAGAANGVPAMAWARNLAAWLVGGLLALAMTRMRGKRWPPIMLAAALACLLATFLSPAQEGVHRWVDLGPVHANLAMLLIPAAAVSLAAIADGRWPWLVALAILAVLAAQPDASQALAFGAAAAAIAVFTPHRPLVRLAILAAVLALVATAWLRPDPLQPVAEVEGVIALAARASPALAGLAVLCMLAIAAAPTVLTRFGPRAARVAGGALGLCLLLWSVAPFLGAFPVPFAGVGPSPVLGAWLGVGLLAALMRARLAP